MHKQIYRSLFSKCHASSNVTIQRSVFSHGVIFHITVVLPKPISLHCGSQIRKAPSELSLSYRKVHTLWGVSCGNNESHMIICIFSSISHWHTAVLLVTFQFRNTELAPLYGLKAELRAPLFYLVRIYWSFLKKKSSDNIKDLIVLCLPGTTSPCTTPALNPWVTPALVLSCFLCALCSYMQKQPLIMLQHCFLWMGKTRTRVKTWHQS